MPIMADQVIEAYVKTRDEIKAITKETEARIEPLMILQAKREQFLAKLLEDQQAQNIKTSHGTAFFKRVESVTMGDWDAFLEYVINSGDFNLLQHAANKTAALEIMGDADKNTGARPNPPPPGVNYTAIRQVQIRAGSKE